LLAVGFTKINSDHPLLENKRDNRRCEGKMDEKTFGKGGGATIHMLSQGSLKVGIELWKGGCGGKTFTVQLSSLRVLKRVRSSRVRWGTTAGLSIFMNSSAMQTQAASLTVWLLVLAHLT